jgi:L-threonylcarbamoyladenylate synthase
VAPVRLRLGDLPEDEITRRVAAVLRDDGIALLPAEGVYGLHASATSSRAVDRILAFKDRAARAGFIGLIARPEDAKRWARVDEVAQRIIEEHWPGALTLVLEALDDAPLPLRSDEGTIALRCPGSSFLRAVIAHLGSDPLLSTSANMPGKPPAIRIEDAPVGISDLNVDGGALAGRPYTVVRLSSSGVRVLRPGAVRIEEPNI